MTNQKFKEIMRTACNGCLTKEDEVFNTIEFRDDYKFSDKLKRRMNRFFRIHVGGDYIPHPEVDTQFERIVTKIIIKILMINPIRKN